MLVLVLASTQVAQARTVAHRSFQNRSADQALNTPVPTDASPALPVDVPTVTIPQSTPITVPTVTIPQPTPTPAPVAHHHRHGARRTVRPTATATATPPQTWIWAFLTSYCPGSAGLVSSSGLSVFYGMLANDYYPFGTHVFIPVIGLTGVVEDRVGSSMWNHFDVWSPVCYSTPTGWFKVAIQTR